MELTIKISILPHLFSCVRKKLIQQLCYTHTLVMYVRTGINVVLNGENCIRNAVNVFLCSVYTVVCIQLFVLQL